MEMMEVFRTGQWRIESWENTNQDA
jgi:hypothetical protein